VYKQVAEREAFIGTGNADLIGVLNVLILLLTDDTNSC
jgi:hypothetical protein